ncbi:MAG: hypothetical protein GY855_01935 [candidate division Zixibacteria bacterium]|nr:hypothetical protein [candidate division Zixibacteria bacterium]
MKYLILILFVLSLTVIFSCSKSVDPEEYFNYPLSVGNSWEYNRSVYNTNFRPVSQEIDPPDTSVHHSIYFVQITAIDTLPGDIETYKVVEGLVYDNFPELVETYFKNTNSGLYECGYKGARTVSPTSSGKFRYVFLNHIFNSIEDITGFIKNLPLLSETANDSINYFNPPLKSMHYPWKTGNQWLYREIEGQYRIDKKVTGKIEITTPAGDFECYAVQRLYDWDDDGNWDSNIESYDYICYQGLVKRRIVLRDVVVISEFNDTLGFYDGVEDSQLKIYNIQ